MKNYLLFGGLLLLILIFGSTLVFTNDSSSDSDADVRRVPDGAQSENLEDISPDTVVHEMIMKDFVYEPTNLTIHAGEAVRFVNEAKDDRWPASNIHPTHEIYAEFDSRRPVAPGESWTFRFDQAGRWYYHDHLEPAIRGSIVVAEAN